MVLVAEMVMEFLNFIRVRICISASLLALAGILLSAHGISAAFVLACSFFACAAVYSYNNITDKEEDLKNRGSLNRLVLNKKLGLAVVSCCALTSIMLSFSLTFYSAFFILTFIVTGIAYSHFRIKKHPLIKNLYTAFLISQLFLVGYGYIDAGTLFYYTEFYLFILAGSILSDLRDYEGDKDAGINTLPVIFGPAKIKKMIYALIFLTGMLAAFDFSRLCIILVCNFIVLIELIRNNFGFAHSFGMMSFAFLDLWLFLL